MKRTKYRFNMPVYARVISGVSALALAVAGVYRLLHVLGVGNMVSFAPVWDGIAVVVCGAICVSLVRALFASNYVFKKDLCLSFGIVVIIISYDAIIRLVKAKDGTLWVCTEGTDEQEHRTKLFIKECDEAAFLASVRERNAAVGFETEID